MGIVDVQEVEHEPLVQITVSVGPAQVDQVDLLLAGLGPLGIVPLDREEAVAVEGGEVPITASGNPASTR